MKRLGDLFWSAGYGRGVGHTPVRGHRLARPYRADFLRGRVAHGEYEVQWRRPRLREFVPWFAAQSIGGQAGKLQLPQRLRMDETSRVAPGAMGDEVGKSFSVQDGLGHDGTRRVSGAKEENVITRDHNRAPLYLG